MKPSKDDLVDIVMDLKHDLGKYIRMPLLMLPEDATPEQLAVAVEQALFKTRSGPSGTKGAKQIFDEAVVEVGEYFNVLEGFIKVEAVLNDALKLAEKLSEPKKLCQKDVTEKTALVQQTLTELVSEAIEYAKS